MLYENIVIVGLLLMVIGIVGKKMKIGKWEIEFEDLRIAQRIIICVLGIIVLILGIWQPFPEGNRINEVPPLTPTPTTTPPTPTPTLSPTVTFTPTPSPSPTYTTMNCFPEVPESRTKVMEAGTEDFLLIGSFESKDEPMVIKFTEYKNPIGYIKLFFFPDNELTKIEKVVNSKCQQIEEYSHVEDGSEDKNVLQTWDPIKIKFENNNYLLILNYDGEEIYARFKRTV